MFDACRVAAKSRLRVVEGTAYPAEPLIRTLQRKITGSNRFEFRLFVPERQDPNGKVIPFG